MDAAKKLPAKRPRGYVSIRAYSNLIFTFIENRSYYSQRRFTHTSATPGEKSVQDKMIFERLIFKKKYCIEFDLF